MYSRQVNFTTTIPNEDIMQNTAVKAQIMEALGLSTADDYTARFTSNPVTSEKLGIRMIFDIIMTADNTLKINGGTAQNLISSIAYSSESAVDVKTLTITSAGSGIITMKILR